MIQYHISDSYQTTGIRYSGKKLNLVKAFLEGRRQRVRVNGRFSSWTPVTSGIPQGSILGPMLFILFINDLPEDVKSDLLMFADDTKIYQALEIDESESKRGRQTLQEDLIRLQSWSVKWQLQFNNSKCKTLRLGPRKEDEHHYKLYGNPLPDVTEEKDLGVTFDRELKYKAHIAEKVKKANTEAGIIRRSFKYLDKQMYKRLFSTIVRPILEYGQTIWSPHDKTQIREIENVQRRSTKQIPDVKEKSYTERLREIDLPCLLTRRIRGDLIEIYKLLHNRYDPDVSGVLIKLNTRTNTRSNGLKIEKQNSRLNCRRYYFTMRCINIWNKLDTTIVNAASLNNFKQMIDKFFKENGTYYDFQQSLDFYCNNT